MRIIAFIEDEEVIKKILKHLGLWEAKARPPQRFTSMIRSLKFYPLIPSMRTRITRWIITGFQNCTERLYWFRYLL
jgi:predicted DNA-binding protein (UPF0278 family)